MKQHFFKALATLGIINIMYANTLLAATLIVTTTADSGAGSLREAMTQAVNQDTIAFDENLQGTILLESQLPIINGSITIQGNSNVSIDGQEQTQIFFANQGTIAINKVILKNGYSQGGTGGSSYSGNGGGALGAGGAVFVNQNAEVTLSNVTLLSNSAQGGDGGSSNTNYYDLSSGGGGGGGYNQGTGGNGGFSLSDAAGGGGGGGFASLGGSGFTGGGGGGGFTGVNNGSAIDGEGTDGGLNGGNGGQGLGGSNTGGTGGTGGATPTDGANGDQLAGGGGGGGGGSNEPEANGGNGGSAGALGGGGGGGGGNRGGEGGQGDDFGGGGGGGGSSGTGTLADGGKGSFGGGGGGGGGVPLASEQGGKGGKGGFGAGGGGGAKNANGGNGGMCGGAGGNNNGGGGGGAGLGGAVFVRNGGKLNLTNCRFKDNAVIAGNGGSHSDSVGENGIAAGEDLYIMDAAIATTTVNFDSQINISGPGTLVKNGPARLILAEHSPISHPRGIHREAFSNSEFAFDVNNIDKTGLVINEGPVALANVCIGSAAVQAGGVLRGVGYVNNVENYGTVRPDGRIGATLEDALIVTNEYLQKTGATLIVEIYANTDSNQLIVTGKSRVRGKLQINLNSGYYKKGTKFVVLTSTKGVTGQFDSLSIVGHRYLNAKINYYPKYIEIELLNNAIVF